MADPVTKPAIRSKLPATGTTIFTVMSALAQQHGAVNLGQGFPDYPIDPALVDLVTAAMKAGHNQYPLMPGVLALREAIAAKVLRLYGRSIDWAALRQAITPRTRLIVVNTPNNPGTSVLGSADLDALAALTRGTDIVVISDEAYEHMVYDGVQHQSVARHDELAARSIVIGSFGKTFHATGWKVGYALAPPEISAEIRRVHQFTVFTVNAPMQHALAAFLHEPAHYEGLPAFFTRKRDLLRAALADTPLEALPCAGSYFLLARYDRVSHEPAAAFAQRLVTEVGVATIPLSAFYQKGTDHRVIRFCFAKRDETLQDAARRLRKLPAARASGV
jgi:methionine aminotransferase